MGFRIIDKQAAEAFQFGFKDDEMSNKRVYEIRVFVEADAESVVEDISDRIGDVLCPSNHHDVIGTCPNPWFVVSHALEVDEAQKWRELLNR